MALSLDDRWEKITSHPKFNDLQDDQKEQLRQRLYSDYIVSSPAYRKLSEARRGSIRSEFDKRITLPKQEEGSGVSSAVKAGVGGAIKEVGREAVESGKAIVGVGLAAAEGYQKAAESLPIKPLKKGLETIETVGKGIQDAIEPTPEEIVKEPLKAKAKFAESFTVGYATQLPSFLIPHDWVNAAVMVLPSVAKAAGIMAFGRGAKVAGQSGELFSALSRMQAGETLAGSQPGQAIPGIKQLAHAEEIAQYEKWLEGSSPETIANHPEWATNFTQEAKTNFSKLRDIVQKRLEALRTEPVRTDNLSKDEFWVNKALTDRPAPPALPAPEQPPLLPERVPGRNTNAPRQPGHIPLGPARAEDLAASSPQTPAKKVQSIKAAPETPAPTPKTNGAPAGEPPISMPGQKGKNPEVIGPEHPAYKNIVKILREMNEDIGKRGAVGPGDPVDPVKKARFEANVKELLARARAMGYTSAEEIASFMARAGGNEPLEFLKKQAIPATKTSVWDPAEARQIINAENGNPEARSAIVETAQSHYQGWMSKPKEWAKERLIAINHESDVAKMKVVSYLFRNDLVKGMSGAEREAMPYYIQKIAPELEKLKGLRVNAEEVLGLVAKPTPKMVEAAQMNQAQQDLNFAEIKKYYDINYVKNYLFQEWEETERQASVEGFLGRGEVSPMMKSRTFPDRASGINAGRVPKDFDIYNIWRKQDNMLINLLGKKHMLDNIALTPSKEGLPSLMDEAKAPDNWIRSIHPMLKGKALNPDFAWLKEFLTPESSGLDGRMIEKANSISRSNIFSFTFMHPKELAKIFAFSYYPWEWPQAAGKVLSGVFKSARTATEGAEGIKELYNGFMRGSAILSNRAYAVDAAENGLRLSAMDEANFDNITREFSKMEDELGRATSLGKKGVQVYRKTSEVFNKAVWDYFIPQMKMTMSHDAVVDYMAKNPNASLEEIAKSKHEINSFINGAEGGLNWSELMMNPKHRRILYMAFLAPDFLVSRMYMAARIPIGIAKTALGTGTYADKMAARMGIQMGLAYYYGGNWMNRMNTKLYEGKARDMVDNPSPHQGDIYRRPDPETKRGLYIEPTYTVSKIVKLMTDPGKTLQESASPAVRGVSELATGHRPGGSTIRSFRDWATDVAGFVFPIPATQKLQGFDGSWPPYVGAFQQRYAAGFEPAKDAYVKAFKSHKPSDMRQAQLLAQESGVNPKSIVAQARKELYSELLKKHKQKAREDLLR